MLGSALPCTLPPRFLWHLLHSLRKITAARGERGKEWLEERELCYGLAWAQAPAQLSGGELPKPSGLGTPATPSGGRETRLPSKPPSRD